MERKIFNYESVILSELTLDKEGFDPKIVGYQKKYIWARCRFCGEPSRLLGLNFKKSGSACHKECRFKEQSIMGSPLKDEKIRLKAYANRNKNFSNEEINKKISEGRKKVQSQIEITNLEKYGAKNVFENEEIKEKIKQTHLEKIKVENPQQNLFIKEKTRKTFQDTVSKEDHYKLVNTLRSNTFWDDLSVNSLKNVCNIHDLNYNSVLSRLQNNEFVDKYYSIYTFPTQQQQKEISDFIKFYNIIITENDRSIITPLELDIYIPSKNFAIEFNGSLWHSEFKLKELARNKHINKTKLCQNKSIRLVHIFENQWQERQKQWKTFIKSSLGLNENKINGRECVIKEDLGLQLCEDNHIQGKPNGYIKTFDLIHKDQWVGSMVFSNHHRSNIEGDIVLSRLVFCDNTTVQGGASKLFKYAINWLKTNGYKKIISWSDNAWTEGNIYKILNFQLEKELPIDYFYWNSKTNKYISKQSQQKKLVNCPLDLTEKEWATERGLYRIWDCGKKRWIYNL